MTIDSFSGSQLTRPAPSQRTQRVRFRVHGRPARRLWLRRDGGLCRSRRLSAQQVASRCCVALHYTTLHLHLHLHLLHIPLAHSHFVVENSCTVKNPSEQHFVNLMERCRATGKPVVVAGCVPQVRYMLAASSSKFALVANNSNFSISVLNRFWSFRF